MTIVEDISEQKELQTQLQRAERLAAAGELAAGVAHEVNNALSGLLGQIDSLRESKDAQAQKSALATMETQAHRIASIVRDLLGFSRPPDP